MATDSVNSGENLRQNVLLAASGTIGDTENSSKIDLSTINTDTLKDPMKNGFWQNMINLRESFCKSNRKVSDLSNQCGENVKRLSNTCVIGSISSLTKSHKNQIECDKSQLNNNNNKNDNNHNFEDTGDCISELIGHIGLWQVVWVIFLIMFQIPSAFHIFSFMFQVSSL